MPASPASSTSARRRATGDALFADERLHLMGLLVGAHQRLTRTLGAELEARCGLPLTWYDVLIHLGRAPDAHLTMTQLASNVSLTSGGITRLVDRVAEAGLVERQNCPSDRRAVHVGLTPAGAEMLDRATAVHLEGIEAHLVGPLSERDRADLARVLGKLAGDAPVCGGGRTE